MFGVFGRVVDGINFIDEFDWGMLDWIGVENWVGWMKGWNWSGCCCIVGVVGIMFKSLFSLVFCLV